jgi:hypothetical protein
MLLRFPIPPAPWIEIVILLVMCWLASVVCEHLWRIVLTCCERFVYLL